ncbi:MULTISPECIES: alpha/beta hydrolase [Rhodococcus]|uniref:Alpha/beta hydrolase n=1 Tax=Rhodococcus cerastii TaxID=908616 RepID=A0ABU4CYV1_9NOCA|nr:MULTISPECIES: alpha/beta hydrolase [Rhodococcus]MDV6302254.1 alpha/beta hydrolase [Rhodococcus cerastii]MDV8058140.1 alpha/beta hydrolase [Rhodococcus sp. IEGM 1343]
MTRTRLGAGRYLDAAEAPTNTVTSTHELTTADGAKVSGVLRTVPGADLVVALMHPRQDLTHHVLVPELLARGYAVWTQGTRSVNNDISLVHEQALLDAAAGQVFLRSHSFDHVVTLGHSGGGTLFAFYCEQAGLTPEERLAATPAGRPIDLASAEMPVPDGAIFMAPHPGQGALLLRLIDPSVVDESDPMSVDPALDPFDSANGFVEAPESSNYSADFVQKYRAAQLERVARLDVIARSRVAEASEARRRFKTNGNAHDRRDALAPRILTVYRTDADLRFTDLSLSSNARPYGSLFGRRPDLTNYGLVGFARLATPDAWLSTWSGLSSNADFVRCAPSVTVPSLFVELTGDQACFPEDASRMVEALGSVDKSHVAIEGTHFGGPIRDGAPTGASLAAADIGDWLSQHFI